MVLISDGSDTGSDANVRDVRRVLRRSDAFVYAIAIDAPDTRPINDRVNPFALREMTTERRRLHRGGARQPRARTGHGADRRRAQSSVHAQLRALASGGWELSLDPCPCHRRQVSCAHAPRLRCGGESASLGAHIGGTEYGFRSAAPDWPGATRGADRTIPSRWSTLIPPRPAVVRRQEKSRRGANTLV